MTIEFRLTDSLLAGKSELTLQSSTRWVWLAAWTMTRPTQILTIWLTPIFFWWISSSSVMALQCDCPCVVEWRIAIVSSSMAWIVIALLLVAGRVSTVLQNSVREVHLFWTFCVPLVKCQWFITSFICHACTCAHKQFNQTLARIESTHGTSQSRFGNWN